MSENNPEMTKEEFESIEELEKKVLTDAKTYIFNVMNFGTEYDEGKYQEMVEKSIKVIKDNSEPVFSVYEPSMMQLNLTTLMQGYQYFGTSFIKNLVDNDPASAKVILESVTQDWFDLQDFIRNMTTKMENAVKQSQEQDKAENAEPEKQN